MRAVFLVLTAAALAACAPEVPDSGVGFGDYATYMRERERALQRGAPVVPPAPPAAAGGFSTDRIGAAIDRASAAPAGPGSAPPFTPLPGASGGLLPAPGQPGLAQGQLTGQGALIGAPADRPRGDAPATIRPEAGEMRRAGISDEQDFAAVSARESIESDAERLARARAQYQVVQPGALPQRTGAPGPNIVAFALATSHAPGTPMYRRSAFGTRDPMANCGRFNSPDLAQEAFLAAGGPERDPQRLDPDGDGFVCGWDPRPFRSVGQ